jgi:hypothetical protein
LTGDSITFSKSSTNNNRLWSFNNLPSGSYTLTITDNGSCTYSNTYTIDNKSLFNVTTLTTGTTCNQTNGILQVDISGGTPPYTFNIGTDSINDTFFTSVTFTDLISGINAVTVTDSTPAIICSQSINYVIDSSMDMDYLITKTDSTNGTNGTISVFITSGEPPFTIDWSNNVSGQTGTTLTNLTGGTYSVTITDDNGCVKTRTIDVYGYNNLTSYQVYEICGEDFTAISELGKKGPKQMLNEGYHDLVSAYTNCVLNTAIFNINVEISGVSASTTFYTGYTLNQVPSDNQYYNALTALIESYPQIGQVIIDPLTNSIQIISSCETQYLTSMDVIGYIRIVYDISCESC